MNKKISIIIPCYNTEKYLERCLESVINQSYKNLEIIVVNDCSPDGVSEILNKYKEKDKRIISVTHSKNKGLFQARISGAEKATGEYIAFLDSDDYIDNDFYRELIETAESKSSDMTICNTVVEDNCDRYVYNMFYNGETLIEKDSILDKYFSQKGLNYRWHTVWNKLYSIDLWEKCSKYYNELNVHLIMTEDFAFSTILYYYSNRIAYNDRANYFYCTNDEASTSINNLSINKAKKNILDIKVSFDFVEKFMRQKKIYEKYKEDFLYWKRLYLKIWMDNVQHAKFSKKEQDSLLEIIEEIDNRVKYTKFESKDNIYRVTSSFNDGLLKIKEKIMKSDVISFDIFDTLITRPFYEPKDLFILLNRKYIEITGDNGLLDFSTIRFDAENRCREYSSKLINKEEVNINEIYEYISEHFKIEKNICEKIKDYEIELELKYCKKRETAYSLYKLSEYTNKTIIINSDMYLEERTIKEILRLNGYEKYNDFYLSCSTGMTKHFGSIYKFIRKKYKNQKILHIGDNYNSDIKNAKKYGIETCLFPKTTDIFFNNCSDLNNTNQSARLFENFENQQVDYNQYLDHLGIRTSLAIIANKFFDNPFITFNYNSDFNTNPYFIGYYCLGMHMFSVTKWMLDDAIKKGYNSISYMARDGHLPYRVSKIMSNIYKNFNIDLNYIYISRKSIFPVTIKEYKDLYKSQEYFKIQYTTPMELIEILKPILELPDNYDYILANNNINVNQPIGNIGTFNNLITIIWQQFYKKEKYIEYHKIVKLYFDEFFKDKSSVFDIGYSAQPELILTDLMNKSIDAYFIHTNSDTFFKKSNIENKSFNIMQFYDYKPTFTGTLREYLISDTNPSCTGYKLDGDKIIPVFGKKEEYKWFDVNVLNEIHNGTIDFVKDICNIFDQELFNMEFPKYYMSAPYEYFLHHSKYVDREIFNGLLFEENVGEKVEILKMWEERLYDYNTWFNKNISYNKWQKLQKKDRYLYDEFLNERVRCRNILVKGLFYIMYDRQALRVLIGRKLKYKGIIFRFLKFLRK